MAHLSQLRLIKQHLVANLCIKLNLWFLSPIDCYDLFQAEKKNSATGGYCGKATERQLPELLYQKRAEKLLADENCFKIFIVSIFFYACFINVVALKSLP